MKLGNARLEALFHGTDAAAEERPLIAITRILHSVRFDDELAIKIEK
jgi:hypothetical protein